MSRKLNDEKFDRLVDALLVPVRQYAGGNLGAAITGAFDALEQIDRITLNQVDRRRPTLLATAASLFAFGQKLLSGAYDELRDALTNNAINLVLLVVESVERGGDKKAADQVFTTAYDYARRLARYNEMFAPEGRILVNLIWGDNQGMSKRLANLDEARRRLIALHKERQELGEKILRNLSSAKYALEDATNLRREALHLFEIDCGDCVWHLRPETPYSLQTAASAILYGEQYIEKIQTMTPTEGVVNYAKRAVVVCQLVRAHVQASLAYAYVEYHKGAKGLDSYEVLAHQAISYAEATQEENWTYFAPVVHIRPEEPLCEESEKDLRYLIKAGETALSYALCLHAQIEFLPARLREAGSEPKKVEKTDQKPLKLMTWPYCRTLIADRDGVSQPDLARSHRQTTGEDLRENSWLGIGRRTHHYPKSRLVGFERNRAGKGHRKTKKSKAV